MTDPIFISAASVTHPSEPDSISVSLAQIDQAIGWLVDDARRISPEDAGDVRAEVQERITRLMNVAKSFSQAAMGV